MFVFFITIQIRMGWTPEMDIEGTRNLFERSVREVDKSFDMCKYVREVNKSLGSQKSASYSSIQMLGS